MSRHGLDAIETEYLISRETNAGDFDIFTDLLGKADILITGNWQNEKDSFNLNIKALEFRGAEGDKGVRVLAAVSKMISKIGLSQNVRICLEGETPTTNVEPVTPGTGHSSIPSFQINYVY